MLQTKKTHLNLTYLILYDYVLSTTSYALYFYHEEQSGKAMTTEKKSKQLRKIQYVYEGPGRSFHFNTWFVWLSSSIQIGSVCS